MNIHLATMSELMNHAIRKALDDPLPDVVLNIESHFFNTTLACDCGEVYDLDVGRHVWLNVGRWSRLIKEYVPAEPLNRFWDQCQEIINRKARLGATANLMFRDPDRYAKKHRWGGCLMGATFRGDNQKAGTATLTFFSRTTYMGYMGLLDAAIAHKLCCYLSGLLLGEDVQFIWHIADMQLHCFKTLPYIFSQPDLYGRLKKYQRSRADIMCGGSPTWNNIVKWYTSVLKAWNLSGNDPEKMLAAEKYGPFKRIKRRWLEHEGHLTKRPPPSLPVESLTFDKAI